MKTSEKQPAKKQRKPLFSGGAIKRIRKMQGRGGYVRTQGEFKKEAL